MKWKSDSIEQFVSYKILHPEQCFESLKNYKAQKRHNEDLDLLYRQLNKYKLQQNYFKSQLHKLNQIAEKQGLKNMNQIQLIDHKYKHVNQQLNSIKSKYKLHSGKNKKQIVTQYQILLSTQAQRFQQQQAKQIQSINHLENKLAQVKIENDKQQINNRISMMIDEINKNKQKSAEINKKKVSFKLLLQHYRVIKKQIQARQLSINKNKQKQIEIKNVELQNQQFQYNQIKIKLDLFSSQLYQLIIDKLITKSNTQKKILSNSNAQSSLNKQVPLKEQVLFNTHIDFSYIKKTKNSLDLVEVQQQQNQFNSQLQQIQQSILQVQSFLNSKRKIHTINYKGSSSISKEQQNNEKIDLIPLTQVQQLSQQYIRTKFNHSSENYHFPLQNIIQTLTNRIEVYRLQSDKFYNEQNERFKKQQNLLSKKQKDLDRQIQHLQTKVTKTDIQINKKNKIN